MKKIFCTTFLLLLQLSLIAKEAVTISVEENVELMSILARTSGFREYNMSQGIQYCIDVDKWFGQHKNHPAVAYMQQLRKNYGISYDAVASMAISLECAHGKVSLLPIEKNLLDKRWENVSLDTFLVKLNSFYNDTHFHDFYLRHIELYNRTVDKVKQDVLADFDKAWYDRFYGKKIKTTFHVIMGMTNGGGNYGPTRQLKGEQEEPFAIMGYSVDKKGEFNPAWFKPTLIHEFNHSFIDCAKLDSAKTRHIGNELLNLSYPMMANQAYTNGETVLEESIVRAAVILYMMQHNADKKALADEMREQIQRDFKWMPELVMALRSYEQQRKQYKTFDDFVPKVFEILQNYIDKEKARIQQALD